MRGLNVNGFIISETLGSGRAGLLYLARNPNTGQEAIICLTSGGDDGLTAKVFLEEATSLRPSTRELSRAKTADGRPVMLAVVPSEEKTVPLPAVGTGHTRHADTELLPARRPSKAPVVVFLAGLLMLGAGLALMALQRRDAHTPVIVVSPPPAPAPTPPAPEPVPRASPPPLEPVVLPAPAPKPAPAPRKTAAPAIVCDALWQRAAELDLANLRRVVANHEDDQLFSRYSKAEEAVMMRMQTIGSPAECAQVNAALDALIAKYSN